MRKRIALAMICVFVGIAGCAGPGAAERSAKGRLLQDAEKYLSSMKEQNQLPGFNSKEPGRVVAAAPWADGNVSYPASVIVQAWKDGQEPHYRYELAKDAEQSPWQLIAATRVDAHGKIIEKLRLN